MFIAVQFNMMSMTIVLYDITVQCNVWYKCEIVVYVGKVQCIRVQLGWVALSVTRYDVRHRYSSLTAGVGRWGDWRENRKILRIFLGILSKIWHRKILQMFLKTWSTNLTLQNANGWLKSAWKMHYLNYKDSNLISFVHSNDKWFESFL